MGVLGADGCVSDRRDSVGLSVCLSDSGLGVGDTVGVDLHSATGMMGAMGMKDSKFWYQLMIEGSGYRGMPSGVLV
jgi:hypothetical protein